MTNDTFCWTLFSVKSKSCKGSVCIVALFRDVYCSSEYDLKINEKHIGYDRKRWEYVNWIDLAQDWNNTVMKLLVP
jgi:hypothetical protein